MHHNLPPYDMSLDEAVFGGDPLEGYTETSSFNIIQFLADTDTPVDSPVERSHLVRQQQLHQHQPPDPHHGAPRHAGMYHNNGRLPDSPPITDISGPGSSASPSSNSDSPYSPTDYSNYGGGYKMLHGHPHNANGLILTPGDLQNNLMVQQCDLLQQQMPVNQRMMQQHGLTSPPVTNFIHYPPQQPTPASLAQISPNLRGNNGNYGQQFGGMDLYTHGGSDGSLHSQDGPSRKKRCLPTSGFGPQPSMSVIPSPMLDYGDENYHHPAEVIKFTPFQEENWQQLYNEHHSQISQLETVVFADKGFNFSPPDGCFVNQKKNHFQISVNIHASEPLPPKFVMVNDQLHQIKEFKLAFVGVKSEMPTSEIIIKQSQTDRKPVHHEPVAFEIAQLRVTKVTVPRLHFSETTMNNMRKNAKPNPDQKYFLLIVRLFASTEDGHLVLVQAYQSDKVIVRATNPGQFEQPDVEMAFQKNGDLMTYPGKMVIGGDKAIDNATLSVHGNLLVSGNTNRPSDERLKENVVALNPDEVLQRYQKYQIVTYDYKPEVAREWGLNDQNRKRAGMIAQRLQELYPEAVTNNGEFLTIDENRLFYDSMVVTQELVQLTHELDKKIVDNVEELQKRIKYLMRKKQMLGSIASNLSDATSGFGDSKSYLSMSTTSLAAEKKERRRGRKPHCHNPSCHRSEPLCSSRLTQGTIVALVVIMAACLLAMSSLYILDWHNRNNNFMHYISPPHKPRNPEEIGTMIRGSNPWLPPEQPGITPLMATCPRSRCHQYCCADATAYEPKDKDAAELDGPVLQNYAHRPSVVKSLPHRVTTIEIVNLNVTLDDSFCYPFCSRRRGFYNLYIPMSSYLPNIPLMLRFTPPRGKVVNNCGYLGDFQEKPCQVGNVKPNPTPYVNQVAENTFEVPAGNFLQSAYRFRVGYTTESCYSLGVYEEYNLIFYRTCQVAEESEPSEPTKGDAATHKA